MSSSETAETIANALGETEETPRNQVEGVISALGEDAALALLKETQDIEAKGGMLVPDGSRRRTPGGVFFRLARDRLTRAQKVAIFMIPQQRERDKNAPKPPPRRRPRVLDVAELSGRGGRPNSSKPFRPGGSFSGGGGGFGGPSGGPRGKPERRPYEPRRAPSTPQAPPSIVFGVESAMKRAQMRRQVTEVLASLPLGERYAVLIDMVADLHEEITGRTDDMGAHQLAAAAAARSQYSSYERAPETQRTGAAPAPMADAQPVEPDEDSTPEPSSRPSSSAPSSTPRSRGATVQQRVLDAISSGDATTLADLAGHIYGEDNPQNRNRVQSTLARLKSAGKVRAIAPGRFEASP